MKNFIQIYFVFNIAILLFSITLKAETDTNKINKRIINIERIEVYSNRETNERYEVPAPISTIDYKNIDKLQINSVRDISIHIPNLFIPDYGSKMSSSIFIRGIGNRSTGQSMGFYVDEVPYLNKSNFDFEFFDIQKVEVLRGSQATLYGRNAMSGIINIKTLSPFVFQGSKVELGVGNYGKLNAKAAYYDVIGSNIGIGIGAYINKGDGYFINSYNNEHADKFFTAGGRIKFEYNINKHLTLKYNLNFETINQNAFPYGYYDTLNNVVNNISFNDESFYKQKTFTFSQKLEYTFDKLILSSITAYQYLNDDMHLDQDFSSDDIFTLQQKQRRNAFIEECILRPINNKSKYKWNIGFFGFYDNLNTSAPVLFKRDGIDRLIENNISSNLPPFVTYSILNDNMLIVDELETPNYGIALFHQSTFKDILKKGLSITLGIRCDYENAKIHYINYATLSQYYSVKYGDKNINDEIKSEFNLNGNNQTDFFQLLPKLAVNYTINENDKDRIFFSISRGYKAGGYNLQMFSDITQNELKANMIADIKSSLKNTLSNEGMPSELIESLILANIPDVFRFENINQAASYLPEYSIDYELGTNLYLFNNKINLDISFFLINVRNMQITQFSPNGFGRMLSNAGEVESKGTEITININLLDSINFNHNVNFGFNYGFTHSIFKNYRDSVKVNGKYEEVDYSGNAVPYVPKHTINIFTNYVYNINGKLIDNIYVNLNYNGVGDIVWNEQATFKQKFYSILNGNIGIKFFNKISLEFYGKNILNTNYRSFYFESLGKNFFQLGKPFQFGTNLKINL